MGGSGSKPRWQRVGRAVRAREAGWYAVDLRGSDIGPDQLDSLRLAGPEPEHVETKGFAVSETVQNGSLLTLKVAEFADLPDAYLWLLKQPPTFLVEALRDGIAGLGETPLASALAAGVIGGASSSAPDPPGFHPAQADAYRACLGQGVHLVWGPPGTGKTTVLKRAIGDLIARGDRILLVSATNIAVDNALLGVLKENRHASGAIVRVGPPQLREVADNPRVSLPLMVRERLAETEERRRAVEAALVDMRSRAAELAALDASLIRFDPPAYFAALKLLRTPGQDPVSARQRMEHATELLEQAEAARETAERAVAAAMRRHEEAAESRRQWSEADRLHTERSRIRQAADQKEAAALLAEEQLHSLQKDLRQLDAQGSMARWRTRERRQTLREQVAAGPGVQERLDDAHWDREWLCGWCDVTASTNERTSIPAFLPRTATLHTYPLMFPSVEPPLVAALVAAQSSLIFDFVSRQKISDAHMKLFVWKQLPVPTPTTLEPHIPFLLPRVLELVYTAYDMTPLARDLGDEGEPFCWDEARRAQLRAELDAYFFHLYGISAEDTDYILETFQSESGGLKNNEIAKYGEYRTKRLVLTEYDRMATAGLSLEKPLVDGETYTSPLTPPPGHAPATPPDSSSQRQELHGP
ncbi:hypothetical protein SHL15_5732 [Streptomyces hygroscopicus subsp. limoneus]|nr:hypothetical protein SHL15_5732 [Streptomyces hygroscopicus subsp. limoneus]